MVLTDTKIRYHYEKMANFVSPNQIQIQIGLVLLVRPDTRDETSQPWISCTHQEEDVQRGLRAALPRRERELSHPNSTSDRCPLRILQLLLIGSMCTLKDKSIVSKVAGISHCNHRAFSRSSELFSKKKRARNVPPIQACAKEKGLFC